MQPLNLIYIIYQDAYANACRSLIYRESHVVLRAWRATELSKLETARWDLTDALKSPTHSNCKL